MIESDAEHPIVSDEMLSYNKEDVENDICSPRVSIALLFQSQSFIDFASVTMLHMKTS